VTRLSIDGLATGGDGVAREPSGRVVFVPGALPGESVSVELVEEKTSFARGRLIEVHDAHARRSAEPCPHLAEGCGGCDFQHVSTGLAAELKTTMVAETLARLGRIGDVEVGFGGAVPPWAYRTTVRTAVVDGRAGFRARRSHDVIPVPECMVVHPTIRRVLDEGRFPGATAVTVRVGAATGECLTTVEPAIAGATVPTGVVVASTDPGVGDFSITEEVAGRSWRVSAPSFFQSCPEAAELLVQTVGSLVGPGPYGRVVDLFAGVGLFAGTIGAAGPVVAVESAPTAVADAAVNLAGLDAEVVRCRVERWRPKRADLVVADPARRGLGRPGVGTIAATGAATVVLVSCDAASFARDAGLLVEAGYDLQRVVVLDLFPQTTHVETVGHFVLR
jgi:23S rRNA (uracil1939-C5)-methyltransferase